MNRSFLRGLALGATFLGVLAGESGAQTVDPLTQARRAYNERQFDTAITAAEQARKLPALSNAAAVVLGRAHLERFRVTSNQADLLAARQVFSGINAETLSASDRTEFLVGLGVSLFVDDCTGVCLSAAAEFFDLALVAGGSPDAV